MSTVITRVELRYEQDVVYARYRARIIAEQLGFDKGDQTRISTAVSEIARTMFQYTSGGDAEFLIDNAGEPSVFAIQIRGNEKVIVRLDEVPDDQFSPETGIGQSIIVAKRLMDHFSIDTRAGNTMVTLGKNLPFTAPKVTPALLIRIADVLVATAPSNPFDEIRLQNQNLVHSLEELRPLQQELASVNRELDETNRGVVALYVELENKALSLTRANEALKESTTLLNEVCEMAHVGGWEIDVTTMEVHMTKETCRIHEISENVKIDLAEAILFYDLPGRSTLEAALQRCIEKEELFDLELPFTSAKRKHLWIRTMGRAVNVWGRVVKLTGTFQNITERKAAADVLIAFSDDLERKVAERTSDLGDSNQKLITEIGIRLDAEKQLTKTVSEKDALLREVHHRVKNNLQIIISLLNIQSRYIKDETTLSAFRESQNRIKVMALVHEKLYRSENLAEIKLNDYLKFMGNSLFQFFGMSGKGIAFSMDIRDISLAVDTAIPTGLIINELISNSLKYAFPEGKRGEISIAIQKAGNMLTIVFKDNGIGIPQDFDWRNAESLGLRLVIILVEQMDGTIELDRSSGTAFTIVVKEKE